MFSDVKVTVQPAVEPISVSELEKHLMLNSSFSMVSPFAPSVALGVGAGGVDNGIHRYKITFVTASGETEGGDASQIVTVVDKTINGVVSLSNIQLGDSEVTARKIYRTKAGQSDYFLVATLANNTATTYSDTIADSALGAECPAVSSIYDSMLSIFIRSARELAEHRLGRYLITQTIQVRFDRFDSDYLELPPCQSVTSIQYLDTNGAWQTLSNTEYDVELLSTTNIYPVTEFPATKDRSGAVVVEMIAGYGNSASSVPASIKQWLLFAANTMWTTRHEFDLSTGRAAMTQVPRAEYIDRALDREKVQYTKANAF